MSEQNSKPVDGAAAEAGRRTDHWPVAANHGRDVRVQDAPCGATTSSVWPLYGATLLMAISLSVAWTAMPFILIWMGGTRAHVGYTPAVNTFAYLTTLLVAGSRFSHLSVRRTTLLAGTVALLATATMSLAVLCVALRAGGAPQSWATALRDGVSVWIGMLMVAGGIAGAAMALYWPYLMSWVSADYEGMLLNRRFGRYNGAWSSGAALGPLIGGWLFEVSAVLPLTVAVLLVLLSQLLLRLGRENPVPRKVAGGVDILPIIERPQRDAPGTETPCGATTNPLGYDLRLLADCRWLSRIALFSACLCLAVVRSQFALVFRSFGYAESQFGAYLTFYALCNFVTLVAAGRWAWWHFKLGLLIVGQAVLLLTLLLTLYGRALSTFLLASVLLGVAFGFAYSSHLYYGASTSRRRSARMVIHETVISLGLTTGSFTGGYLAEHVSLYAPYWFAVGIVGLGLAGQATLHGVSRARGLAGPASNELEPMEP